MKNVIGLVISLFTTVCVFGQDTTGIQRADSTESLTLVELNDKLKKIISIIEEDKDTTLKIGNVFLKQDLLTYTYITTVESNVSRKECKAIRNDNDPSNYCNLKLKKSKRHINKHVISDSSKIKDVRIILNNGVISDIFIYTKNGMVFSNNFAPISLNRINKGTDKLSANSNKTNYYVQLNSVLKYEVIENYIPSDDNFILTASDTAKAIYKNSGINSLINVRLYSDILGLIGKESNGLAQTEIDFSIPIHRRNVRNKYLYWFSDLNAKAQLSRLDEKYQSTGFNTVDSSFSRITFNQRKWFNLEIGTSIFSGNITKRSNNKFSIDLLGGINVSSFAGYTDTVNYVLPYLGLNPSITLKSSKNFGVNFSAKLIWERFPDKQTDSFGNVLSIFSPELELFFNPLGKPGSKIFSRINYTTLTQTRGAYWNFQFGYNVSISELINDKKE